MEIKKRTRRVAIIFLVLICLPILFLTRWQVVGQKKLENDKFNNRQAEHVELRGRLLDRNGLVLAQTGKNGREYPYSDVCGPLLGYLSPSYGVYGLEAWCGDMIKGFAIPRTPMQAYTLLKKENRRGDDVVLTIDVKLQEKIFDYMQGYRGACVVMDAETGELLAMVSLPSYDPNPESLNKNWKSICSNTQAPLIERASQGMYPPGSTFKILVLSGALSERKTRMNEKFKCEGGYYAHDFSVPCMKKHGVLDLREAVIVSCNTVFAELGLRLGRPGICSWMKKFGMTDKLNNVPYAYEALLPKSEAVSLPAEAGIGQGDMLVTPLHMARVAGVIAEGGLKVDPQLIKARLRDGEVIWEPKPSRSVRVISRNIASTIGEVMHAVVAEGTGAGAQIPGIAVAGKTGTAENPEGQPHAWFIGYAPAQKPKVVCAVILENAGGGGKYAAPIAGYAMEQALKR
ncbi:MAG: cell division protein FtsI [bacterium]|nr:cell division protein FtsI [bacterium]